MNKKCSLETNNLNINPKKKINERIISKKEKRLNMQNKSYKSSSNNQFNTNNNKSNESDYKYIYKTIMNGSLKNLKINEKSQLFKKK